MQSDNYVPGVSGWKIDPNTGNFELNSEKVSAFGTSQDAIYSSVSRPRSNPVSQDVPGVPKSERKCLTVTAVEWSESEIPAAALARYKFIGDAVMQIPTEYRESAEFSTEDHSYDRDGSDIRTTLTYCRPETPEEATARVERAKVAGTRVIQKDGCLTIIQDGVVRVRLGDLSQPFVVNGDQVLISDALIDEGKISTRKIKCMYGGGPAGQK